MMRIPGKLTQGHQAASKPSKEYPYGTLEKQTPYFKQLGLDLSSYFNGTLNISIAPLTFEFISAQHTFDMVNWTDLHPPETFSFSRCKIIFDSVEHSGWVYYPHPETKKTHFQDLSILEVITEKIPGIKYGDELELELNPNEIKLLNAK